jgi:hypothetical protein
MSQTNSHGYILPIDDLSMSMKYGNKIATVPNVTAANCVVAAAGTITSRQLLNGYISIGFGAGGGYAVTTPIGAELKAMLTPYTTIGIGTSFKVLVNNSVAQIATWTAGISGVTVVGTATLAVSSATEAVFVCTAADGLTWKTYLASNA